MNVAYLCLGGNIEKRETYLKNAIDAINAQIGEVRLQSAIYETDAWGSDNQLPYLNMCLQVETELDEIQLLKACLNIEINNGRIRDEHNQYASRTIDIDVLFFNDLIFSNQDVIIPHPRLHLRRFVLIPLAEIAPDYIHPVFKKNTNELNQMCSDSLSVKLYQKTLV